MYPEYRFYHLAYPRLEYLVLWDGDNAMRQDFVGEMVYSLANLFVSVEADGFVGSLTSNW